MAAGLLLLCTAVLLYGCFYVEDKNLVDLRALLSLFWIGGIGVTSFQLSNWQTDWNDTTWLCLGLFYLTFVWCYGGTRLWKKKKETVRHQGWIIGKPDYSNVDRRLYLCIWVIAVVSMVCFLIEVLIMGYIPIFSKETHAYNTFHVTGIHYFTFSCMMVHPLTLIYILRHPADLTKQWKILAVLNGMALSIAIMCVSKFQFALTVMLPIIIFLLQAPKINWKKLLTVIGIVGSVSVIIVILMVYRRNYEPGYLNGVFDMKNLETPMIVQYVYMYIANNFENFNCLVATMEEQSLAYTMGMRMLFPVFALTGLKFVFPQLTAYPIYVVIPQLNTLTILYDAYYDFGVIGVVLFGAVLGFGCAMVTEMVQNRKNPIRYLLYGQVAMYQILSFFSTWYSIPTTWFWFALTFFMYLYVVWPASPEGYGKLLQPFRRKH